jgi:bacteriocin-like protein
MTDFNNEAHELDMEELNAVSGGGLLGIWIRATEVLGGALTTLVFEAPTASEKQAAAIKSQLPA